MIEQLGTVKQLMRYPVKSMMGERIASGYLKAWGLDGDRICGLKLRKGKTGKNSKDYLTARKLPEIVLYKPRIANAEEFARLRRAGPKIEVTLPEGQSVMGGDRTLALEDPRLLGSLGRKIRECVYAEVYRERSLMDQLPLSLVGMPSIDSLEEGIDPLRFRMNVYIDWDKSPFYEETLIGKEVEIGEAAVVKIERATQRCGVVNVDPDTGTLDVRVLKEVKKKNNLKLGVYASVIKEGQINEGDGIRVRS